MFPSVTRDLGSGVQSRSWERNVSSVASKATDNPCSPTSATTQVFSMGEKKKKEEGHQGCCLILKTVSRAEKQNKEQLFTLPQRAHHDYTSVGSPIGETNHSLDSTARLSCKEPGARIQSLSQRQLNPNIRGETQQKNNCVESLCG